MPPSKYWPIYKKNKTQSELHEREIMFLEIYNLTINILCALYILEFSK
jgi:hypothetical protein